MIEKHAMLSLHTSIPDTTESLQGTLRGPPRQTSGSQNQAKLATRPAEPTITTNNTTQRCMLHRRPSRINRCIPTTVAEAPTIPSRTVEVVSHHVSCCLACQAARLAFDEHSKTPPRCWHCICRLRTHPCICTPCTPLAPLLHPSCTPFASLLHPLRTPGRTPGRTPLAKNLSCYAHGPEAATSPGCPKYCVAIKRHLR